MSAYKLGCTDCSCEPPAHATPAPSHSASAVRNVGSPAAPPSPAAAKVGLAGRRSCVQKHIEAEFGFDLVPEFFRPGCDTRAHWDFERWAAEAACGDEPEPGSELLKFHTAWAGPLEGIERRDEHGWRRSTTLEGRVLCADAPVVPPRRASLMHK